MKNILNLCLLLFLFTACSSDDERMLCETGPVLMDLEVLEEGTSVNLIETGVYTQSQIDIRNEAGEAVEFNINNGKTLNVLLGWEEKTDTYTVSLGEEVAFDIVFNLESIEENSCTNTQLEQLEITGLPYEHDQTTGIYTVFVPGE